MLFHDDVRFGEVQFYFQMEFNDQLINGNPVHSLALIRMYTRPDEDLFQRSSTALSVCHLEDDKFTVVPLTQVKGVVGMVPFNPPRARRDGNEYFIVEKMGHVNKFYSDDDGNICVDSDVESDGDLDDNAD